MDVIYPRCAGLDVRNKTIMAWVIVRLRSVPRFM